MPRPPGSKPPGDPGDQGGKRPFEDLGRTFSVGMGAPGSEAPPPPKGYVRPDEQIREEVRAKLSTGYIDASEIEVDVADGAVTLRGSVPDKRSKDDAEDLIRYVAGIREIQNQLRVLSQYDQEDEIEPRSRPLS